MKIGDVIYHFDSNHRVYRKDAKGHSTGSPIYREHWREIKVIGETSRSWLVGVDWHPDKIAKKDLAAGELHGYCLTLEEVEKRSFVADNRHHISNIVSGLTYDKLKAVADLIGYKPEEHDK